MMRFIREFLAFYRLRARGFTPTWEPGDAESLAAFLKTASGERLMNNLLLESIEQDRQATVSARPESCGAAMGFRIAVAVLKQFSEVSPDGDKPMQEKSRADLLRERISP